MSKTFIFSIRDEVDGSCYKATDEVFNLTGLNLGNLAFHYACNKILGGRQEFFPWHATSESLNETHLIGVIPCANQLGPHADFGGLAKRFQSLTIPLVAIGLGAQGETGYGNVPAVPLGTQEWVQQIASRSSRDLPNIGVRGPFTLKVLEHYGLAGHAVILGCPTLFLNPDPHLGEKIFARMAKPYERVAVAAGHQGWKHLSKIEASLTEIMEASGGSYFVQSPVQMVSLARGEAASLSENDLAACRDYSNPRVTLAEFVHWSRRYFRAHFNISEWMESLRCHDFVVGARIHGVMLGLQAGIPSLCIAHDSRTRELCETMLVPFIMASDVSRGFTLDELLSKFTFDPIRFDENRREIAGRFSQFLLDNEIAESALLKRIASQS